MDVHYMIRMGIPLMLLALMMFSCANSDDAKDREECTQQLVGLATCLPYVGGNSKAPTPDCCSGLKQALKTSPKCLCVIVKDRNNPELGLNINATLALGLPTVCNSPANISQCPALLHLAPNSTDAQIFYQYGHSSSNATTSPTTTPAVATANATSASSSDGHYIGKRWLGLEEVTVDVLFLWFFTSHFFII